MIKWFRSLNRQGKIMAVVIVVLLIGVIIRWQNIRDKAGIWFRLDEIVEERRDTLPATDTLKTTTYPPGTDIPTHENETHAKTTI